MAALLKEVAPDTLESTEAALEEVRRLFVQADARRGRLEHRMMELRQGRDEFRRRRARNTLDAYLPPLEITYFERDTPPRPAPQPAPPLRAALPVLFAAFDDVFRLWWRKFFARRTA